VELGRVGECKVVQILQQPEVDKECTVVSQGVAVGVAEVETAPAVHVAAAAAVVVVVAAAVAAAAIGSFVSRHSHNSHTEQTALVEGAVVRARVLGPAQMAIVDYMPAAVEVELLLPLWRPPNTPNSLAGWPEEVVDLGEAAVEEDYKEVVAAQRDSYACSIRGK
jgi:hypothetical protein